MSWQALETGDGRKWEINEGRQAFRIDGKVMSGGAALAIFIRETFGVSLSAAQAEKFYETWLDSRVPPGVGKTEM